jgi:hypothetical protein
MTAKERIDFFFKPESIALGVSPNPGKLSLYNPGKSS